MSLRWNHGVHNFMIYGTGDIPVGHMIPRTSPISASVTARPTAAFGYTYFNPATGHEFSAVTGVTYNFTNNRPDYQNGVDWHLDWGASQFLTHRSWSVWSATSTNSSPPTGASRRSWAISNRACSQ